MSLKPIFLPYRNWEGLPYWHRWDLQSQLNVKPIWHQNIGHHCHFSWWPRSQWKTIFPLETRWYHYRIHQGERGCQMWPMHHLPRPTNTKIKISSYPHFSAKGGGIKEKNVMWYVTNVMRHVTTIMWYVTKIMWHVTNAMRHIKNAMWHVKFLVTWHRSQMSCNMSLISQHVTHHAICLNIYTKKYFKV